MLRFKTLSVLAGISAVLALSAAPASAWWESNTGQSQGVVKPIKAGEFIIGESESSPVVTCNAEEVKAIWYLQTKGQLKEHQKNGKQELTTKGPHLHIQVKSWGNQCTTKVSAKEKVPTAVSSECEFQIVQQKESFEATAGVVTGCLLKINTSTNPPLCEVQVPPGMEKQGGSNEGINVGLKKVTLENVGSNQLDKVNVTTGGLTQKGELNGGIFANSIGTNALCPLPRTITNARLVNLEFEAEGVKAV